jgi:hypothetical protein
MLIHLWLDAEAELSAEVAYVAHAGCFCVVFIELITYSEVVMPT